MRKTSMAVASSTPAKWHYASGDQAGFWRGSKLGSRREQDQLLVVFFEGIFCLDHFGQDAVNFIFGGFEQHFQVSDGDSIPNIWVMFN